MARLHLLTGFVALGLWLGVATLAHAQGGTGVQPTQPKIIIDPKHNPKIKILPLPKPIVVNPATPILPTNSPSLFPSTPLTQPVPTFTPTTTTVPGSPAPTIIVGGVGSVPPWNVVPGSLPPWNTNPAPTSMGPYPLLNNPANIWYTGGPFANSLSALTNPMNPYASNPYMSNPFMANPYSNPLMSNPYMSNPNPYMTNPMMSNPYMANPMMSNPLMSNPYMSNPMMSNPLMSNPYMANPMMSNPFMSNPYMANPMMSNPYMSNPYMANPMMSNPFMATSFNPMMNSSPLAYQMSMHGQQMAMLMNSTPYSPYGMNNMAQFGPMLGLGLGAAATGPLFPGQGLINAPSGQGGDFFAPVAPAAPAGGAAP